MKYLTDHPSKVAERQRLSIIVQAGFTSNFFGKRYFIINFRVQDQELLKADFYIAPLAAKGMLTTVAGTVTSETTFLLPGQYFAPYHATLYLQNILRTDNASTGPKYALEIALMTRTDALDQIAAMPEDLQVMFIVKIDGTFRLFGSENGIHLNNVYYDSELQVKIVTLHSNFETCEPLIVPQGLMYTLIAVDKNSMNRSA